MFNVLIAGNPTQWETDQLMRMDVGRFQEYSGIEAENISASKSTTLRMLEGIDALLMYESGSRSLNADIVRYGSLHDIRVAGKDMVFRFEEKGRFQRTVVEEFAGRLGIKLGRAQDSLGSERCGNTKGYAFQIDAVL